MDMKAKKYLNSLSIDYGDLNEKAEEQIKQAFIDGMEEQIPITDVIGRLSNDLNKKFEDHVIEGLKRKGFEFKYKIELEAFVKERCRCEDNIDLEEKVYYVDNIPFFLHNYKSEPLLMPSITDREYKITANLGTYAYI
jgi:methyl coenzyme M reductase subunit D